MYNFKEALKTGLASAVEEANNLEEIELVFETLKENVENVTGGCVSIKLANQTTQEVNLNSPLSALHGPRTKKYTGLMAFNISGTYSYNHELCEWDYGCRGYPVTLDYSNKSIACADKESLINALQDLLMRPESGKKIKSLMDKAQE